MQTPRTFWGSADGRRLWWVPVVMLARAGCGLAAARRCIASRYEAQSGHRPTVLVPYPFIGSGPRQNWALGQADRVQTWPIGSASCFWGPDLALSGRTGSGGKVATPGASGSVASWGWC